MVSRLGLGNHTSNLHFTVTTNYFQFVSTLVPSQGAVTLQQHTLAGNHLPGVKPSKPLLLPGAGAGAALSSLNRDRQVYAPDFPHTIEDTSGPMRVKFIFNIPTFNIFLIVMFSGLCLPSSSRQPQVQLARRLTRITTRTTSILRRTLTCSTRSTPGQLTTTGCPAWLLVRSSPGPGRNCLNILACMMVQSTLRTTSSRTLPGYFSRVSSELSQLCYNVIVDIGFCWCEVCWC